MAPVMLLTGIGLLIWALRTWRKEQVEKPAFRMAPQVVEKEAY